MVENDGARSGRAAIIATADAFEPLQTLIVARSGNVLIEEGFDGHLPSQPTNIKSASKSILSAMVGIAIDKGLIEGVDQPIADFLSDSFPENPDPRLNEITIGHLLSMQAGLQRTSGGNYGRWIANPNWVSAALAQPFVAEPGTGMLYSTGSSHLLSAILTRVGGRDTMALANEWLSMDGAFRIADWERDPQGIPLGGNQMAVSPKALFAFGELYRNGGEFDGETVVPAAWITQSWTARTNSVFSGERYGYNWFIRNMDGYDCFYAWGYGGQMLYILPELDMTVVITSDTDQPSGRSGYKDDLHAFVEDEIIPFVLDQDTSGDAVRNR
ncbi:serine hydrolase domain-containing protein [Pararhizobium haloflavum]|uniref:serine hydrolase domain-containing protein n=1 Tax=Pararhizobium haloflavum TaxID=2037914 RepID=UPI0035228458